MNDAPDLPADIKRYRRLATAVVKHYFGKPADRIVYKRTGRTNYVFSINHIEGQFVVRISPDTDKIDSFRKEHWVTRRVRDAGVPTQEVLAVGNDVIPYPYMIARRVSGHEATNHPRRLNIVQQIGRYAAVINSIRTNNFGNDFDWKGSDVKTLDWRNYLLEEWQAERRLDILLKHQMLSVSAIDKLRKIIDELVGMKVKPYLSHGDLRTKNVIVDEDGHITAIIDWDDCLSTVANAWELSIALHDLTIDEKHSLLEGYGCSNRQLNSLAPIMRAFNIMNYSNAIEAASKNKDVKALKEFKLRLSGQLDLYSL